jgi:hypothetical protein
MYLCWNGAGGHFTPSPMSDSSLQPHGSPQSPLSSSAATQAHLRPGPAQKPMGSFLGVAIPTSRLQLPGHGSNASSQMPAGQPSQSLASSGAGALRSLAQTPARQPSQSIASSGAPQLERPSSAAARPPPPGFASSRSHLPQQAASSPAAVARHAGDLQDTGHQAAYKALVRDGSASSPAAPADAQPSAGRSNVVDAAYRAAWQRSASAGSADGATSTAAPKSAAAVPYCTQAQQVCRTYTSFIQKNLKLCQDQGASP